MERLVSWIEGGISEGFYYLACLVLGLLCSASKISRPVLFWIAILLMLCILLERAAYGYFNNPDDIQCYAWFVRLEGVTSAIIMLVMAAVNYRDLMNREIMDINIKLAEISMQMHQIMEFVDGFNNEELPNTSASKKKGYWNTKPKIQHYNLRTRKTVQLDPDAAYRRDLAEAIQSSLETANCYSSDDDSVDL